MPDAMDDADDVEAGLGVPCLLLRCLNASERSLVCVGLMHSKPKVEVELEEEDELPSLGKCSTSHDVSSQGEWSPGYSGFVACSSVLQPIAWPRVVKAKGKSKQLGKGKGPGKSSGKGAKGKEASKGKRKDKSTEKSTESPQKGKGKGASPSTCC